MAKFAIVLLLFLTACQHKMMTGDTYAQVEIGESIQKVKNEYGKPYAIHHRDMDSEIYEYNEKIMMGTTTIVQKRYFLVVREGRVVGKYVKIGKPTFIQQIYSNDPYPTY